MVSRNEQQFPPKPSGAGDELTHRGGDDALDEGGLGVGVGLAVGSVLHGELPLQPLVVAGGAGVGAEVVAEGQVRPDAGVAQREHVDVRDVAAIDVLLEVEASGDAVLAETLVPERRHAGNGLAGFGRACGDRHHVQDGLRRQSRHGGAADVVHLDDPRPAGLPDGRRLALERQGPFGAVLDYLDVSALRAERMPINRDGHPRLPTGRLAVKVLSQQVAVHLARPACQC